MTLAITDPNRVSVRQASSVAPSLGDLWADQSSLIRELICEELCRGLGCRSRHLKREDSWSSPPPHHRRTLTRFIPCLVLVRLGTIRRLHLTVQVRAVGPLVGTRLVAASRPAPPTCREGVLIRKVPGGPPAFVSHRTLPSATVAAGVCMCPHIRRSSVASHAFF